ncbi:hypothetical protein KSS87_017372 [Heliosperma pusillum]|nr:hypothetical protein KSS87_017372 [Heliosperma pusillum]
MEQITRKQEENEKVCKRCKGIFTSISNSSSSCRFHPSFFVCRRHDDQIRFSILSPPILISIGSRSLYWVSVSVSSVGISKLKQTAVKGIEKGAQRYYELGPDDPPYAAKFYDCCGAEDPDAPGCKVASHISYDDE